MKCYDYPMPRSGLFLGIVILLTWWFSRWVYLVPTDWNYLQDRFEHSQWRIPNSSRVISDNELYQVAGRALVQGADPFSINPEVPPLAKYTFGWSNQLTGNPYWATFIYYLATLVIFYLLAKEILQKSHLAQLATLLFAISPIFLYQMTQTMLDLPQTCFLLLHILGVLKLTRSQRSILWLVISGLSLGAAAACKFPLIIPLVAVADVWLFFKAKKLSWLIPLFGVALLTYITTYLQYFLLGHSLIDWLKAQKWVVNFYLISKVPKAPLTFWIAVFSSRYQGWWGGTGSSVGEWSLIWPVVVVLPFLHLFKSKISWLKLDAQIQYLLILFLGLLVMFTAVPFWPRYFLSLLPIGLLLSAKWLASRPTWLQVVGISLLAVQAILFMRPQPTETITFTQLHWQERNYEDMGNYILPSELNGLGRNSWAASLAEVDALQTQPPTSVTLESKAGWILPWQNQAAITAKVTYPNETKEIQLTARRYLNHWYIEGIDQLFQPQRLTIEKADQAS